MAGAEQLTIWSGLAGRRWQQHQTVCKQKVCSHVTRMNVNDTAAPYGPICAQVQCAMGGSAADHRCWHARVWFPWSTGEAYGAVRACESCQAVGLGK